MTEHEVMELNIMDVDINVQRHDDSSFAPSTSITSDIICCDNADVPSVVNTLVDKVQNTINLNSSPPSMFIIFIYSYKKKVKSVSNDR